MESTAPAPHVDPAPAASAGRTITVFSPKGGTGKTTIATNLAVALHQGGRQRVCLLDLDLEFGDVAISLSLEPIRSLVDAVTDGLERDEDDAVGMLLTEYRPGLDCILAPIEPGDAAKIPADIVSALLAVLPYRYDYVVVDTSSQFSENVLAALDASDHHVLIANPEIPSLKNLRLTLDMLDLLSYGHDMRSIVFNRADDASGLSEADMERALRAPIAARVPASRDVPASINRGVPIVAAKPDHQVSKAIRRFASEVIVGESEVPRHREGRGRMFRRRSA
jgi:pilus assembly protein CpaE